MSLRPILEEGLWVTYTAINDCNHIVLLRNKVISVSCEKFCSQYWYVLSSVVGSQPATATSHLLNLNDIPIAPYKNFKAT
jgi:hypothetical protein